VVVNAAAKSGVKERGGNATTRVSKKKRLLIDQGFGGDEALRSSAIVAALTPGKR
jgi:hypothetical protein